MIQDRLILRDNTSPFVGQYADITQGSVLSWDQLDGNFIYLKGNIIYSASTNGNLLSLIKLNGETIEIPYTGSGDTSVHNNLLGLQGGQDNEYYHFTEDQHIKLLDLIYSDNVVNISVSPTIGERGVLVGLTVTYNMLSNDDTITAASINNGIGDVLSNVDSGNVVVSAGSYTQTTTFTLSYTFDKNGDIENDSKTATYTAAIPQWAGVSLETDFTGYTQMNTSDLQKFIQVSASINKESSPVSQYIWFISNKSNAIVRDQNDFIQITGPWGDGTSEFYTKSLSLTLADGITNVTVYLYRSREIKNLLNFTYKIS